MQDHSLAAIKKRGGGDWYWEYEPRGYYMERTVGGCCSLDSTHQRTVRGFRTRDDAVREAQAHSFAVYVEVDHSKYITKKSYADNFKWKGPADHYKADEGDGQQVNGVLWKW